jgi:tripartite-type tricarboxylate transporter receptor subunit TctC
MTDFDPKRALARSKYCNAAHLLLHWEVLPFREKAEGVSTMKLSRRQFLHLIAGAATVALVMSPANHEAWSQATRPIRIVVPYPPGGGSDILARLLADQIGRTQGQTILVENRPGAGSAVGTEAVSRATPDGSTLLINTATIVIGPHLNKLNYDVLVSFEPVCLLATTPLIVSVNSASPHRTLADFLNAARAKAGELTVASVGPGTTAHVAFEKLKRASNVNLTYVPYSGTAPAVNALLGAHVSAMVAELPAVGEQLKAGKLRALAVGSRARTEALPQVPTIAESGYPDYEIDVWWGLFAPAKTPPQTMTQTAGWFTAALHASEMKPKFAVQEFYPARMCGADFAAFLRKQYDDYGRIIREANIKTN